MKIENKIFKDFMLKKIDCNSEGMAIEPHNEGIKMTIFEPTMVMMSLHTLNKSVITNFKPFDKFTINDLDRLDAVISSLPEKGQFTIITTKDTLTIDTDTETQTLCAMDEECISVGEIPTLEYEFPLNVSVDWLKRMEKMVTSFGGEKKRPIAIEFHYKDSQLYYEMENDNETMKSKPINVISSSKDEQILRVSIDYFLKIVKRLSAPDITFYMKSDYPLQIKETVGTFINSTYILAPRVDNDDEQIESEEPPLEKVEQNEENTGDTSE